MLIEATDQPVRYRFRDGREILFRLGKPIELPDTEARHLLERAAGKVRPVGTGRADWLTAWRDVAEISSGLTKDDVRLPFIMAALGVCDAAFEAGDFVAFQRAKDGVLQAMKRDIQPGGGRRD